MVHLSCHFFILLYKKPSWNTHHPQFPSLPFENGLSWKLQLSYPEEEAICKWPPWRLPLSSLSLLDEACCPLQLLLWGRLACYARNTECPRSLLFVHVTENFFSYNKQACKSASFIYSSLKKGLDINFFCSPTTLASGFPKLLATQ